MANSEHTRRLWIQRGRDIWVEVCPGSGGPNPQPPEGDKIGVFASQEDSERAVACRNGCAGVPHPEGVAAAVKALRESAAYECHCDTPVGGCSTCLAREALAALGLEVGP